MAAKEELKMENFTEYDFTEDWPVVKNELLEEYCKLGVWEKYFTYKMTSTQSRPDNEYYGKAYGFWCDVRNKYSEPKGKGRQYYITDPDTYSKKLQELYGKLWKEDKLLYCKDKLVIHGDTMNSVQTTLSWYVRICYKNTKEYYAGPANNGFADKNGNKLRGSLSQTLQIFQCEKEKFLKMENRNISVEEFIKCNHFLGNYMPVPFQRNGGRFNVARAASTNDFWDLTLYHIYCWYEKNNNMDEVEIEKCDCEKNKDLCDLLGKNCQNIKLCIQWLKAFGSWDKFVEENYLDPYVVVEDGSWGIPKLLWCNDVSYDFEKNQTDTESDMRKLWENRIKNNKCDNIVACEQYFKNAKECIEKRTILMIKKLSKKEH